MKTVISGLALLALVSGAWAQTRQERIAAAAQSMAASLAGQRHDLHQHPELSNRETRTAGVIAARLKALGFTEIRTGVAHNGVVALLKGGKPGGVVALRADMDALPIEEAVNVPYRSQNKGVMHACGHDIHMTVALGTAELLSKMKAELPGTVKFVFQPAEEGPPEGEKGGATMMIAEGAMDNPRPAAIFALHTSPMLEAGKIGWGSGGVLASSDKFFIRVSGKRVHAAMPHQGIDAVVLASECVLALQTIRSRRIDPVEPLVLSIGMIQGGNRYNIIADEVLMQGTLRTHNEAVRERAKSLMKEILEGVAKTHGGKAELTWSEHSNPVTYNPPELVDRVVPILGAAIGKDNLVKVPPVMPGEDFAYFQKVVPGMMYWLGVGHPGKPMGGALHTADFDGDDAALVTGVRAMSNLIFDYLERYAK